MGVNKIRELTAAELNEVAGGLDPVSILVGGAVAIYSMVITDGIINGGGRHPQEVLEGWKKWQEGLGR